MNNIFAEDLKNIAKRIIDDVKVLSGKTLLITGGAGFLGNYLIGVINYLNQNYLEKPCRIISIDNFITGIKYNIIEGKNFKAIKHNIKDPIDIDEDIHFIIHAAGIASPRFYREYKIETIDVATIGTKNMLEIARKKDVESMLFFSSSEVYGDPDPRFVPTHETYNGNVSCTGPRANYDESKRIGETLCVAYYETYNVPVKMVRPFNIYGPGMRSDDFRVIPNFVSRIMKNESIQVYGGGGQTRTFCYVTDGITGFFKVLFSDKNGEPFNVGNDKDEISMEKLAEIVIDVYGSHIPIIKTKGPNDAYVSSDPRRRCPDLTKIMAQLGYHPEVNVREGLRRFIEWAKESYKEKC